MLVIYFDNVDCYLGSDPDAPQEDGPAEARKFTGAADAACVIGTLPEWAKGILDPRILSFDPDTGAMKEIEQ
jgi:hypothetical protein